MIWEWECDDKTIDFTEQRAATEYGDNDLKRQTPLKVDWGGQE